MPLSRCALSPAEVYRTPLYDLRIDQKGKALIAVHSTLLRIIYLFILRKGYFDKNCIHFTSRLTDCFVAYKKVGNELWTNLVLSEKLLAIEPPSKLDSHSM